MRLPQLRRYGAGAAFYDVLSCEKPVYRVGRARAVEQLALHEGDRVLDIACGTGLNFPHLRERIGPSGHIVGVDASAAMLNQARRKFEPSESVDLLHGDAGELDQLIAPWTFDAVIVTYALSIINDWRETWTAARRHTRSGGRIAIVDLALPTGFGRLFAPAARLACLAGGVDRDRRPWEILDEELDDATVELHRWGHVVVAVGTNGAPDGSR